MKTQEMHDRLLENLMKITGKGAEELVVGLHSAGVAAHAAGDGAVNEARAKFFAGVAAQLGVSKESVAKYADNLKDDHAQAVVDLMNETGKSKADVVKALHEVGLVHQGEYDEAVAANHEGYVVRAAEALGLDRSIIEKAFIFD